VPEELVVVTVFGMDKPGIVAGITSVLAEYNANIVDIAQTVLRGIFTMTMVVDIGCARIGIEELREKLKRKGEELGVMVSVNHIDVFKYMQRV